MSDMTLLKILRDLNLDVTVHGFRSAFRDWVAEDTNVPGEVAEAALAHANINKVKAALRAHRLPRKTPRPDARLGGLLHIEGEGLECLSGLIGSAHARHAQVVLTSRE